ncbi:MAG TPA: GAF domain-containing protein, partial [Anaerolineae bacterium]|nr:GAF domain-containing protein [Anaerolineae bacterium]
ECSLFLVDPVSRTIELKASSSLPEALFGSRLPPISSEPGAGLTAYVADTGQSLNYARGEHKQHPAWSGKYTLHIEHLPSQDSHSVLIIPLRQPGGKVLGVLKMENKIGPNVEHGFLDDEELLTTLANQAATAISNVAVNQSTEGKLQRRVDQISSLRAIDTKILTTDNLDEILQTILEEAVSLSGARSEAALIALHCRNGSALQVRASRGPASIWAGDLAQEPAIERALAGARAPALEPDGHGTCKLAVPVRKRQEVCGVLAMQVAGQVDHLEEARRWLEALAGQVAIAVEREERAEAQAASARAVLLSGLSSIYAHNTNDFIGTIPLNAEYLRRRLASDDPEVNEMLEDIARAARNMMALASDLRRPDIARSEPVDVVRLVHEAREQIHVPETIEIHVRAPRELPAAFVPRLNTREVLSNVLKNAVQAITAAGAGAGTIDVTCTALPEQKCIVLEVHDTGCGITPDRLGQLFEPLWLQPGGTGKGMGYALYWAKTVLTAIGGTISAQSGGTGQGSTFRIELPAQG